MQENGFSSLRGQKREMSEKKGFADRTRWLGGDSKLSIGVNVSVSYVSVIDCIRNVLPVLLTVYNNSQM